MTILFAGTSAADFEVASGGIRSNTTAAQKSPRVSEGCETQTSYTGGMLARLASEYSELWCSCMFYTTTTSPSATGGPKPWRWQTQAGVALIRTNHGTTGVCNVEVWNGSAYVIVGTFSSYKGNLGRLDLYVKLHASTGRIVFKLDGNIFFDFTGQTLYGSPGGIGAVALSTVDSVPAVYSEVIVADENTENMQLHQLLPNGNGGQTAWTGDYTAVDEVPNSAAPTTYDTDVISASAAGQTETMTHVDLADTLDNFAIAAVVVAARGQATAAPTKVQGVLRKSSVNYAKDTIRATPATYGPLQAIWLTDPSDNSAWSRSKINSCEFGFKAVA